MEQTKPIFDFEVDDLKEDGLYTMPVAWASSLGVVIGFIAQEGLGIVQNNPDAKRQLQSAEAKLVKADKWFIDRNDNGVATDDDLVPEKDALTGREVKAACRAIESVPLLRTMSANHYYLEAVRTLNGLRKLR